MYNSFYGLSFNPFDKQQLKEKDHFVSNDFREMTNRLNYLKDIRGIGVFTARPGMGKSYALRCFAAGLNPSLFHMEYRDFAFKKKLPILPIVYEAKRGITMRNKNYSFFMYKQSKRTPFRV